MGIPQKLEKSSGILFFAGFFLSKLQYIPFQLVSSVFRFVALGVYFLAYSVWLIASILQPDQKKLKDKWYGFAQIKEQYIASSLIGLIATGMTIAAVFIPILFPPAAWLYLIGNLIWTIGEYHKLKNQQQNTPQNSRQEAYVYYALTVTSISLISAISATLILLFPPLAIPVTVFSLLICVGLGALSFDFLLYSNFGDHRPVQASDSYQAMSESGLRPSVSCELTPLSEPSCGNSFFRKKTSTPKQNEDNSNGVDRLTPSL